MQFLKTLAVCLTAFAIGACGSADETASKVDPGLASGCSANGIKQWAYENMTDYYLFADQVPVVNPASYATAATLVEDLRVLPFDRFSRVTTTSGDEEVFVEGKSFGIGVIWQNDSAGDLRVAAVYDDSPLGRAQIKRGFKLTSINNVLLENLSNDLYNEFVGTRENPATSTWSFEDPASAQEYTVSITPALFDINTVLHSQTLSVAGYSENIGYLVLDSFLGTTEAELDAAIAGFRQDNIKELILDLRYNGGGLVSVATKLASQIAGTATEEKLLMEYRHNVTYSEFDFAINFESVEDSLNLERLIVLTSGYTASASELVISALSPYIEVVTIGTRTVGKPYISFGNDYCGERLHALQAEGFNAGDVSVYGGIAPSCGSTDDVTSDFGAISEGMLNDALDYLEFGRCDTPILASAPGLQNDDSQGLRSISAMARPGSTGGARIDRPAGF